MTQKIRKKHINYCMQNKIKKFYIIGIGGISLSALAVILRNKGYEICGSDICENEMTSKLGEQGFGIEIGSSSKFVKDSDAIIYTSAASKDNKDILLAKHLHKPIYSRAFILGQICKENFTLSISGTHGKTTTTGMIYNIFDKSNVKSTLHIGGILNNINSNVAIGKDNVFITEACEYKDSFLSLQSDISIVLNIKEDHLDYFGNIDNIFHSFQKFVQNTKKNGVFLYNFDDFYAKKIKFDKKSISFGLSNEADLYATNIKEYKNGRYSFDVVFNSNKLGKIHLPCFGKHNIYNALASIAAGLAYGFQFTSIKKGVEDFKGIKRRFEIINEDKNLIIHDYAHHPDEIIATLNTCKSLGYKKVVLIFQPHTFSRTKDLYNEFIKSFSYADETWFLPIYPAREKPIKGITSKNISKDMKKMGYKTKYFSNFEDCKNEIIKNNDEGILYAILGAGDIVHLADLLRKI